MDLKSKGCTFTWSNNREGDELVKERLDRATSNLNWRLQFPEAEVYALPAIDFDHSPLLLSTFKVQKQRRKSFSFEAFWLEDEECKGVINKAWATTPRENEGILIRLEKVTIALQNWSMNKFLNGQNRPFLHNVSGSHTRVSLIMRTELPLPI